MTILGSTVKRGKKKQNKKHSGLKSVHRIVAHAQNRKCKHAKMGKRANMKDVAYKTAKSDSTQTSRLHHHIYKLMFN